MICAACGQEKELCRSTKIDGVQLPRICKECVLDQARTVEDNVKDELWIKQLVQAGDAESISNLIEDISAM